jgi:hypothetical protein
MVDGQEPPHRAQRFIAGEHPYLLEVVLFNGNPEELKELIVAKPESLEKVICFPVRADCSRNCGVTP